MADRDTKPDNVRHEIPWLGNVNRRRVNEEHELARGELRHDDGEDRRGHWGMR